MRDTEILNLDSAAKVELDFGSPSGQAFVQPTCIRCKFSSTLQTSVLPGMPNIAPVVSMAPVVSTPLPSLPAFSWASLPLPPAPTLPQAGWNLLQKALLRIWKEYFWMDCVNVRPAHWQVKGLKNSYCKHMDFVWTGGKGPMFAAKRGWTLAQVLYLYHLLRLNLRNMAKSVSRKQHKMQEMGQKWVAAMCWSWISAFQGKHFATVPKAKLAALIFQKKRGQNPSPFEIVQAL